MTNPSSPTDVDRGAPARPWRRRVWDRIPGWARAGLWGLLVLLLVQIAVGVRIWYGLQDPPEVAAIRGPGVHILPETRRDLSRMVNWPDAVRTALEGSSADEITAVRLDEQATDELVAHIAEHFPNVESLYFSRGNITTQGLLALKRCSKLKMLDVSYTDVDDGLSELLPLLPKLRSLFVMFTNVGDGLAQVAAQHPELEYCPIEGTDITPEAVAEWQAARPKTRIQTDFDDLLVHAAIRWSDGVVSRRYHGKYKVGRYGPQKTDGSGIWLRSSSMSSTGLDGLQLRWSAAEFKNEADGTYQLRLELDGIEAEPVEFTVTNGVPSVSRIEFRMPVPRPKPPQ